MPAYVSQGLTLCTGMSSPAVKELQRDLRSLGYLRAGIDGDFGPGTEAAVKALQIDLVRNAGEDAQGSPKAPVAVKDFNTASLNAVDGKVTQALAECITKMMAEPKFPKLPFSLQAAVENAKVLPILQQLAALEVPLPFLIAILEQESDLQHYRVPSAGNEDNFILVGLDTNDKAAPARVTSRGYGVGQYTFFHHPLTQHEIDTYVRDVANNVHCAIAELLEKFNKFVVGPADTADDHADEHPSEALRICQHQPGNALRMKDCRNCLNTVAHCAISANQTHWFADSPGVYAPTQYHRAIEYRNVPVRKDVPCDWPYAARRYNGSGVNSFHYQTKILMRVLAGCPSGAFLDANTTEA